MIRRGSLSTTHSDDTQTAYYESLSAINRLGLLTTFTALNVKSVHNVCMMAMVRLYVRWNEYSCGYY